MSRYGLPLAFIVALIAPPAALAQQSGKYKIEKASKDEVDKWEKKKEEAKEAGEPAETGEPRKKAIPAGPLRGALETGAIEFGQFRSARGWVYVERLPHTSEKLSAADAQVMLDELRRQEFTATDGSRSTWRLCGMSEWIRACRSRGQLGLRMEGMEIVLGDDDPPYKGIDTTDCTSFQDIGPEEYRAERIYYVRFCRSGPLPQAAPPAPKESKEPKAPPEGKAPAK
jgi:hypothetical protein